MPDAFIAERASPEILLGRHASPYCEDSDEYLGAIVRYRIHTLQVFGEDEQVKQQLGLDTRALLGGQGRVMQRESRA